MLPFTKTWIDLKSIMLCEIDAKGQEPYGFTQMQDIKQKATYNQNKFIDTDNSMVVVNREERMWGG